MNKYFMKLIKKNLVQKSDELCNHINYLVLEKWKTINESIFIFFHMTHKNDKFNNIKFTLKMNLSK